MTPQFKAAGLPLFFVLFSTSVYSQPTRIDDVERNGYFTVNFRFIGPPYDNPNHRILVSAVKLSVFVDDIFAYTHEYSKDELVENSSMRLDEGAYSGKRLPVTHYIVAVPSGTRTVRLDLSYVDAKGQLKTVSTKHDWYFKESNVRTLIAKYADETEGPAARRFEPRKEWEYYGMYEVGWASVAVYKEKFLRICDCTFEVVSLGQSNAKSVQTKILLSQSLRVNDRWADFVNKKIESYTHQSGNFSFQRADGTRLAGSVSITYSRFRDTQLTKAAMFDVSVEFVLNGVSEFRTFKDVSLYWQDALQFDKAGCVFQVNTNPQGGSITATAADAAK